MRDLTTIAAIEGEKRKQLQDVRLALRNRRDGLLTDEQIEAKLLDELAALEQDAVEAFARTRTVGLPVAASAVEPVSAEDDFWGQGGARIPIEIVDGQQPS